MTERVSDEVWQQLDHRVGDLPRRTRRRALLAATTVTLAGVAFLVAWYGGVVAPRFAVTGVATETTPRAFRLTVQMTNENGWAPVRVLGAGRSGPGLQLVDGAGVAPRTVDPGRSLAVTLAYRVTDCAAVSAQPWPLPVRVERPWGTQTVYVELPTETSDAAPQEYTYRGHDPYAVQWQRYRAERACRASAG